MARGTRIIVSANPQGKFLEGIISGTPKPGTCMEVVPGTPPVGGRFTYRAVTRADGTKGPIIVLLPDTMQGKLQTDAYVSGTRGFLYTPIMGEELNMLLGDVAGTGDIVTQGDLFGVAQTSGKIKANAGFAATPFQANETLAALTADSLVWVTFNGDQA